MSELKETVFKITNSITKTSGEIFKSAKLTINLASEEDKLKSIYTEIGKKVHEIYIYGGTLGAAFDDKIELAEAQQKKINDLKNRIDAVKGTKTCAACGKTTEKNAEFCPKCGHRSGEPVVKSEKAALKTQPANEPDASDEPVLQDVRPMSAPAGKACPICGKINEDGVRFCYHCGRVL